jgi:purine-binding chemotaxis protein CheW
MTDTKSITEIVQDVAGTQKSETERVEAQEQVVVFELDHEEYGVKITDIKEIIKVPEITPIPDAPDYVKGILNLRGGIVVVIDLEKRIHLVQSAEVKEKKHIIIAELDKNIFGIEIDQVLEVLRIPVSKIKKSPANLASKVQEAYIKGVVVLENGTTSRLIIMLDLPALLSEKNLNEFEGKVALAASPVKK